MVCHPDPSRPFKRSPKRHRLFAVTASVFASSALTTLLLSFAAANVVAAAPPNPDQSLDLSSHDTVLRYQRVRPGASRFTRLYQPETIAPLRLSNLETSSDPSSPIKLLFGREDYERSAVTSISATTHSLPKTEDTTQSVTTGQELPDKQTSDVYVFARRSDPRSFICEPGVVVANLFSRRDLRISHPPLVPNSNSRLLIGLILICILALGILTVAVQQMYGRVSSTTQPGSPLRRRSNDGRISRSSLRSDLQCDLLLSTDVGAVSSLEEEEEGIRTPPALLRRSSGANGSIVASSYDMDGADSQIANGRKNTHDLHYLSLPFGLGIGFSYSQISDRSATQARVNTMGATRWSQEKRERSSSEIGTSSSTLSILGGSSVSGSVGSDGLRSRGRSFKDMCKDAIHTAAGVGEAHHSSEERSNMSTSSTPRWTPPVMSVDAIDMDSGSGATTPTANTAPSALRTSESDIALHDLASLGGANFKGKARYFTADETATTSHTLVDLDRVESGSDLFLSDPREITRPASSPAAPLPSQIPRHPQVEQLRRQGRTETGKRVGKGTPTNTKVF